MQKTLILLLTEIFDLFFKDKIDTEENEAPSSFKGDIQRTAPVNIEEPKGGQQRRRRRKKRLPSSSFSEEFSGNAFNIKNAIFLLYIGEINNQIIIVAHE